MSQILTSSAAAAEAIETKDSLELSSSTSTTMATKTLSPFEVTESVNVAETFESKTCPSQCMCTCPQVTLGNQSGLKKVDLDISLLPCARTAAYQLDLAIKLCKRK